ncbi:unnamed protein product [Rhodiola kirilowii]
MVSTPRNSWKFRRQRSDINRWISPAAYSYKTILLFIWLLAVVSFILLQKDTVSWLRYRPERPIPRLRPVVFNLTDFGAIGDGKTLNTRAFEKAVLAISKLGGGQLNVQRGRWLTAPFNLTSHMTLFLAEDAVILGVQNEKYWPLMPPLPSYGSGRERAGPRYGSLIHGQNLTDVVITDSCEDMVIKDCYISVGDDGVAIKSGWDQFGISYGRPSRNILIQNLVIRSIVSAGVSIGSEMSGGVSNVTVENLRVWNSRRGVRIKTAPGRGGYVRNIVYKNLEFDNVRVGIVIKTDYNEHPETGFDPKALPILENISFTNVHGQGVRVPVRIYGSPKSQ